MAAALPGAGIEDKIIASEDGRKLSIFNGKGKHLRTLDAATGTVLYSFSYDEKGRLATVTDVDGLTTTVERDASGNATAIVAPNGDSTELTLDANGYLSSVANPAQETVELAYDQGGLLHSLTDPKNNTTRFPTTSWGALPRMRIRPVDSKRLSHIRAREDFTATAAKNSGARKHRTRSRTSRTEVEPPHNTDPSGLKTETISRTDGDRKVVTPDGTTLEKHRALTPASGCRLPMSTRRPLRPREGAP